MPKYVIFNTIHSDGIGDFSHFEDIMRALLANPKFRNVEFIPIIHFQDGGKESNYRRIGEKLKALNIPYYYGKYEDHVNFSNDKTLQKKLSEADQVISISLDNISDLYKPYLKKDIPFKGIGEHEALTDSNLPHTHSLGLRPGLQGIKIANITPIQPKAAWKIIAENDYEFSEQLLKTFESENMEAFIDNNLIIPAYFNKDNNFISFLHFVGANQSLPDNKNIIVYHSGSDLSYFLNNKKVLKELFIGSNIRQIDVVQSGNNTSTIEINKKGSRSIKIFSGIYLTDLSYDAIYQLAKIAGVSGDNTFERCISMNILPYYYSTNMRPKIVTIRALKEITQLPELGISSEARESFKIYFDTHELGVHTSMNSYLSGDANCAPTENDKFPFLDLPKMSEAWPKVTAYLRQHRNFYNNLERIVLENLPAEAQPASSTQKQHTPSNYEGQGLFKPLKPSPDEEIDLGKEKRY